VCLLEEKISYIVYPRIYVSFSMRPLLQECNAKFVGFASDIPVAVKGQFTTRVDYKNRSAVAGFIVVTGNQEHLLSYKTAKELGIIQLHTEEDSDPEMELPMNNNHSIRPTRQKQSSIPGHMREVVERETLWQMEMGSSDQVGEISNYGNWLAGWATLSNITLEQVELASQKDKTQQQLIQWLNTNGARNVRSLPPELSEYRNVIRELDVTDGGLLLRGQRLVIPRTLRVRFIQQTHVDHRG
jgi:hypothetical protein